MKKLHEDQIYRAQQVPRQPYRNVFATAADIQLVYRTHGLAHLGYHQPLGLRLN